MLILKPVSGSIFDSITGTPWWIRSTGCISVLSHIRQIQHPLSVPQAGQMWASSTGNHSGILMIWLVKAQKLWWWANLGTQPGPLCSVSDLSKLTAYHYNTGNASLPPLTLHRGDDQMRQTIEPLSMCTQARALVCVSHPLQNLPPSIRLGFWQTKRLLGWYVPSPLSSMSF